MIIAIHQPQYLPWLGYFHKIMNSDAFVFLDDVQYKKREFQNRNKIRTNSKWLWLTIPVIVRGRFDQEIRNVEIDNSNYSWQRKHYESIKMYYNNSPHFLEHSSFLEETYIKKIWGKLIDINVFITEYILKYLDISIPIYFSSQFRIKETKTKRIVEICRKINADTYLSGIGAKEYLDEKEFKNNNIKLIYQNFKHPIYEQRYEGFEAYMSIIDLLFNCGKKSRGILM